MFKHILTVLSILSVASLSARVTVINNTNEDIKVYPGYQGWNGYDKGITVKKNNKNFNDQSMVGGITLINTAGTQSGGPYYVTGKENERSYAVDSITATITKDANGRFKAVVEPKQTI